MTDVESRQEVPRSLTELTIVTYEAVRDCIEDTLKLFNQEHPGLGRGEPARAVCQALAAVIAAIIVDGVETEQQACRCSTDIEDFLHDTVHVMRDITDKLKPSVSEDDAEQVH